jgi:hypothetical protein
MAYTPVIILDETENPINAANPLPVVASIVIPPVTIGAVSVNNAGGAAAVNIQDGGNTITVDGTVAVTTVTTVTGITNALPSGTNTIGATKDSGPNWTVVRTYTTSADMHVAAAITVAPTAGQKIIADDILISSDTAMLFDIEMESSANVLAAVRLPVNGTVQITLRDGLKGDTADKKLYGKASVAGNVYITVCYHSEV